MTVFTRGGTNKHNAAAANISPSDSILDTAATGSGASQQQQQRCLPHSPVLSMKKERKGRKKKDEGSGHRSPRIISVPDSGCAVASSLCISSGFLSPPPLCVVLSLAAVWAHLAPAHIS